MRLEMKKSQAPTHKVNSPIKFLFTSIGTTPGTITTERALPVSKKKPYKAKNKYRAEGFRSGTYCWTFA